MSVRKVVRWAKSRWRFLVVGNISMIGATFCGLYVRRQYTRSAPRRSTQPFVTGGENADALVPPLTTFFGLVVAWRMMRLLVGVIPLVLTLLWSVILNRDLRRGVIAESFGHQLLHFLTTMGPTYIKLGQWLASRPDIFPPEMCTILSKLFDNAPPHSWAFTESSLRESDILRHLSSIEKKPLNSGSVAQVHRAVLRDAVDGIPAGSAVAIKVMHPRIRDLIVADIAAMRFTISVIETLIPSTVFFDGRKALSEFSSLIQSQLDLRRECDNLEQFRYNFRNFEGVVFPAPAPSISTKDVLVETFEDGAPLQHYTPNDDDDFLAEIGCHMFLKMLFEDNFVHSDLHSGNLLVRQAATSRWSFLSPSKELVVLDPGLVTMLSSKERDNFISLFAAVATGDGELGAQLMLDRMPSSACPNREQFKKDMKGIFDAVGPGTPGFRLSDVELGKVLGQIMNTVRVNRTPIDGNFTSLVVTVIVGEGLGRKLSPDFNIFAESAPYMIKYLESSELFQLVSKLQETYGAATLVADTISFEKTHTYLSVAQARALYVLDWVSQNLFP